MKMLIVNLFSENNLRNTLVAVHAQSERNFEDDWAASLSAVVKKLSVDWVVGDVLNSMRDKGWDLKRMKTVKVSY